MTPLPLGSGKVASLLRLASRTTPGVDLRLLGRTLLHAALVGAAAGLVGAAFVFVLEQVEHLVLERLAGYAPLCAAGEHCEPSTKGAYRPWLLLFLPALGALLAGLLGHRLAHETLGGGADTALHAFHNAGGQIRRRVVWLKVLTSTLTLGFGGAGGREGPTMLIGATIGSTVGRTLRISPRSRRILLVAGMAAGVSAVFRCPLGAALLATEILYRDDFESDGLVPAVLASVVSYSVFTVILGESVLFAHADSYPFRPAQLPYYAALALFVSVMGIAFARLIAKVRSVSSRLPVAVWARPAFGGLAVGLITVPLLIAVSSLGGLPDGQRLGILGGGYGAAQAAIIGTPFLPGGLAGAAVLAGLAIIKMLATSLTVGTGGSAGEFGPSLAIGALLGGAFGLVVQTFDASIDPGAFALVGMGTMYGGIGHVPLSSVVLVCELTGSYDLLVPLMLCAGVAFVACRRVTLYEEQPWTRRDSAAHASELDVLQGIRVEDVMVRRALVQLSRDTPAAEVARNFDIHREQAIFPVVEDERCVGIVSEAALRRLVVDTQRELTCAAEIMLPPFTVGEEEDLHQVLSKMLERGLNSALVLDEKQKIIGLLDESEIGAAYHQATVESHG